MYQKAQEEFEKYMKSYDLGNKLIAFKYRHTYKVVELMEELAKRLNLSNEEIELSKVIGLLHDIGRFEQVKRADLLDDIKTNINHAEEAINYLFTDNHIRDFIEIDKYDVIIKNAISNHNKLGIEKMDSKSEIFSKMIRDMDKVDIYRVTAIELERSFNASEVTEEVLRVFSDMKTIPIPITKTPSDKVLVELGFIFDINFEESFDILDEIDNLHLYISMVNVDEHSEKLWKKITDMCYEKLREGIIC